MPLTMSAARDYLLGVGEAAESDECRRPGPDARDGEQRAPGLLAVGTGVEGDRAVGQGGREGVHGASACAGQADGAQVGVGQRGRPWERVRERADVRRGPSGELPVWGRRV